MKLREKNYIFCIFPLHTVVFLWLASLLFSSPLQAQNSVLIRDTAEQKDLADLFKSTFHIKPKTKPPSGKRTVYYSFLPVGASVPGGGQALVTSTTAAFYLGDAKKTSLSSITFSPYITFNGRFGYTFKSNLWLNENKWDVIGDTRFLFYPQYTWGLGGKTKEDHKVLVDYKYIRFYQTFLRRIRPYFLAGFGYHIDNHIDVETLNDTIGLRKFTRYPFGTNDNETYLSTGLSLNVLYDSRKNAINPFPGYYANLVYRFNPGFMGSKNNWHSLYLDVRKYISFSKRHQDQLALWSFYWTALNSHVPYLDLPSIGWDPYQQHSGRGFDQNRYRGKGLLYFESEYRRDITSDGLLGFVVFANVHSVTERYTNRFTYLHVGKGVGLRIKFNKGSRTNFAFDYSFSKHYNGIAINLGETF